MNLGYACINMTLSDGIPKTKRVMTNRSMIRRTFDKMGTNYASELALLNCIDLFNILKWNKENNFSFYRLSSEIFPWSSEYEIYNLKDYDQIEMTLDAIGKFANAEGMRLTCHPGPFNKLCSHKENVVLNTIKDLETHANIFDIIGLPKTPFSKINIHVGATYGNKQKAADAFCRNFERLSDSVKSRLTVENDDKASLYSTKDLYELIYKRIGIPIVHDFHHHLFCDGGLSQEEALELAVSTWGDVKPVVHYSQSKSIEYNNPKIKPQAHSDFYWEPVNTYGHNVDVMCEAKAKEKAVIGLREMIFNKMEAK